jgi:uncharacterized phage protein gp47/JayE
MASQADVASQMISALQVTAPDLDTSAGSVARKIIDATSSQIADASIDTHLLTYQYDIYSHTGADLDAFVQLFGMTRFPATAAAGTVTFTRLTTTDVVAVPVNSQVSNADGSVIAQTLTPAIFNIGVGVVSVPVQATVAGPAGNVQANSLTQIVTPVSEVSSATNLAALTGGANQETDSQLQTRWVNTVFKSMSGTESMFLGIALNNPSCHAANVVGTSTQRDEQVQVVGNAAASTVNDAQYIYPSGQVVGRSIDAGDVAVPGLQYTWNYSVIPPVVQVVDTSYFPPGQIVELKFSYLDTWSRNIPASGILNRVDVWCAGVNAIAAAQTIPWSVSRSFSTAPTSPYYTGNYVRPDSTPPAAGNIFLPLAFVPILTMDPIISVGSVNYGLATAAHPLGTVSGGVSYAYQIVHENDAYGWGPYSNAGLEWAAGMAPPAGSVIAVGEDYTFNNVPAMIQRDLDNWRLAATDVMAHQALTVLLKISIAVIFDPNTAQSTTVSAIQVALANWLTGLGFNATIYPSSVIQQIENTPGVTACRFLTAGDVANWNPATPNNFNVGIQQVNALGNVINSFVDANGNPLDIILGASQIPAFGNLYVVPKAANSFGAFV